MLAACSKQTNTERKQVNSNPLNVGNEAVSLEQSGETGRLDSIVIEDFSSLLRNRFTWIPDTCKVGLYVKAIPNLGPKGETTVHVCIARAMFDTDGICLICNSKWNDTNYSETCDCLFLGAEELMDEYGEYRMTYDIHDSVLTINTTESDVRAGTMTITHTYSVRYWNFRYLSSDTVLNGDTVNLGGVFDPREAHLGYKMTNPMSVDDDSLLNDPRWAYAEEKLWNHEVCAFLCDLARIADGWLGEVLDYILFESLHNNPETNRCMAEFLATQPASEQEWLLQVLLHAMGMSMYDYTDPEQEQLIYPDFDSFMKAFPVFDSPYNSKVKQTYDKSLEND